jgi:hypothetical protein
MAQADDCHDLSGATPDALGCLASGLEGNSETTPLSLPLSVPLPVCLSVCLSVYLSLSPSLSLSLSLSVSLSLSLSLPVPLVERALLSTLSASGPDALCWTYTLSPFSDHGRQFSAEVGDVIYLIDPISSVAVSLAESQSRSAGLGWTGFDS